MKSEFEKNIRQNAYFCSLPAALQETILQSGAPLENEQDLKKLAEAYMEKQN